MCFQTCWVELQSLDLTEQARLRWIERWQIETFAAGHGGADGIDIPIFHAPIHLCFEVPGKATPKHVGAISGHRCLSFCAFWNHIAKTLARGRRGGLFCVSEAEASRIFKVSSSRRLKFETFENWWRQQGSNLRPSECKSDALPAELCPHTNASLLFAESSSTVQK